MQDITIARPYAKAAFDFAATHKQIDTWYQCLQLMVCIVKNKQVAKVLKNPTINEKDILTLFSDVLGKEINVYQQNFLALLGENRRLDLIPEIALCFYQARANYEKTLDVTVTSTYELTQAQKKRLQKALENRFLKKVHLNCTEDRTLLGGAIIRANHLVFDGTGKRKLEQLKKWIKM